MLNQSEKVHCHLFWLETNEKNKTFVSPSQTKMFAYFKVKTIWLNMS